MSLTRHVSLVAVAAAALLLAACGRDHDHDHEHGDHDHDHGHAHAHAAPHDGALAELGEHQGHVEFVLDAEAGELTLYVLDDSAEDGVRSATETVDVEITAGAETFTLSLASQANALSGETVGDSSVFVGRHDSLVGAEEFTATIAALEFKGATFEDVAVPYPHGAEE